MKVPIVVTWIKVVQLKDVAEKNSGDGILFFVDGMSAPKRRRVRDPWLPSKALIARKAGMTGVSLGARAAASSATAVAGLRLCDQSHILLKPTKAGICQCLVVVYCTQLLVISSRKAGCESEGKFGCVEDVYADKSDWKTPRLQRKMRIVETNHFSPRFGWLKATRQWLLTRAHLVA